MPLIDTLKLKTNLELAGMDDAAIADALSHADVDQLATKTDLKAEIATVNAEIATVKADIATVKADSIAIKAEIADLKADIKILKGDFKKGFTIIMGTLLTILVKLLFF